MIKNKIITAEKFRKKLKKYKIETRSFFWPMNQQTALKKLKFNFKGNFPNSEYISRYGFYLPSGLGTSKKEINYVCKYIRKIAKEENFY